MCGRVDSSQRTTARRDSEYEQMVIEMPAGGVGQSTWRQGVQSDNVCTYNSGDVSPQCLPPETRCEQRWNLCHELVEDALIEIYVIRLTNLHSHLLMIQRSKFEPAKGTKASVEFSAESHSTVSF